MSEEIGPKNNYHIILFTYSYAKYLVTIYNYYCLQREKSIKPLDKRLKMQSTAHFRATGIAAYYHFFL